MLRTNLSARTRSFGAVERRAAAFDQVPAWLLLREQTPVLVFGGLFLLGVALGSTAVSWLEVDAAKGLLVVLGGFVEGRGSQPLAATFLSALTPNLVLLLVLFLCGFCAVSLPILALVPVFKGLGFGMTASAMLVNYGVDALGYLGALVLPNLIWTTVLLLMGCRDSLRLSGSFWNAMRPASSRTAVTIRPAAFCGRYLLYALLVALGAAIEAYSFLWFAGFFGL